MLDRLVYGFYWLLTAAAIVSAILGVGFFIFGAGPELWIFGGYPEPWKLSVAALVFAGLLWLAGRAVLWLYSGE